MAKKIGIAALILLVVLAAGLAVLWQRTTALPDWYEEAALIGDDGNLQIDQDWVQIPMSEAPAAPGQAPVADAEVYQLRNPHMRAKKGKGGEQLRKVVKQSRAVYSKGSKEIEAGAVVNMGDMDVDKLKPKERERYEDIVDAFPALSGRDVYLGVEGDVRNEDGKIVFGPGAKLVIGKTSYSMKSAAKRLGMSEKELQETLGKELGKLNIKLPS